MTERRIAPKIAPVASVEQPMALPPPMPKNRVQVGPLLMAFGLVGANPTKATPIAQIEACEVDAARSAEFFCCLAEARNKALTCVTAWNNAPLEDRLTKVFNAHVTLQFDPFDFDGLLRSGSVSAEARRALQPWLFKAPTPTAQDSDDPALAEIARWLKSEPDTTEPAAAGILN